MCRAPVNHWCRIAGVLLADSSEWEHPYTDPDSGVLLNRLGLTDGEELRDAEASFTFARIPELDLKRLVGAYDFDHLRAIHPDLRRHL